MINLRISEDIGAGCDVRTWKYPLLCLYKNTKMAAKFNEL